LRICNKTRCDKPVSNIGRVIFDAEMGFERFDAAARPIGAGSTAKRGFLENERVHPIQDRRSIGVAAGGICRVGACRRREQPA
jgi:hypothetical protein